MWPRYCKFFDQGYCSRKTDCPFLHHFEICESSSREECDKSRCLKRHPKLCKFDFNCNKRGVCAFRHTNSSVMYVPGGGQGGMGLKDNFLLLKSFLKAHEGEREVKLSFFTKHGKAWANMEIELATEDTDIVKNEPTINSSLVKNKAKIDNKEAMSPKAAVYTPINFETPIHRSVKKDCYCVNPTPMFQDPSLCFWCYGFVKPDIANKD